MLQTGDLKGFRMSAKEKHKESDQFVTVNRSGSISVKLGQYLKSDAGRKQLADIGHLRDTVCHQSSGKRPK